jgi:hypothetical protein
MAWFQNYIALLQLCGLSWLEGNDILGQRSRSCLNVLAACANTPVANNGIETDADCLALCGKQDAAINLSVLANNQPVFSCQQSTRHLSFLCINQPGYSMEPGRKQWP